MPTITYSEVLETTRCWCGIALAVPANLLKHARNDGQEIYCPLGHTFCFRETEADRLRKRLEREQQRSSSLVSELDQETARRQAVERSRIAIKGELTKVKKRAAGGACPCCNRSFVDVARHMKSKHPGYALEDADA